MALLGVDVARYQGSTAPFGAIESAGAVFAFAKATEGTGYVDPTFRNNAKALAKGSLVPGFYHFLRNGSAAAQADHFLKTVGDPTGKLLAFDVEPVRDAPDPEWADVKAFVKRYRELAGDHPLMLYTGAYYWPRIGNPDADALDLDLWNARYSGAKGPLKTIDQTASFRAGYGGWRKATFVQFTSSATVGGVRIDADLFDGTLADLTDLTAKPKPKPLPPTERPSYALRYNQTIEAAAALVATIQLPNPPTGPGGIAGAEAAREDAADALTSLKLGGDASP